MLDITVNAFYQSATLELGEWFRFHSVSHTGYSYGTDVAVGNYRFSVDTEVNSKGKDRKKLNLRRLNSRFELTLKW